MRSIALILCGLLLQGCLVELLTTTAIQGQMQAEQATAAQNTLNRVTNDTGQIKLQRAVDLYRAEKGANPETLDQLVPGFIDPIPKRADGGEFGYNPVTGTVLDDDAGPAPADYRTMEEIRTAINAYGNATGYFPPTLDTLAQAGYLNTPPRTVSGEPFHYNNQNGAVSHPRSGYAASGSPAQRPAGGGGGAGPLGETMTGIAIQQQLNSNSNAGTSAASARGRSGARDAAAQQTQRQMEALDELGY